MGMVKADTPYPRRIKSLRRRKKSLITPEKIFEKKEEAVTTPSINPRVLRVVPNKATTIRGVTVVTVTDVIFIKKLTRARDFTVLGRSLISPNPTFSKGFLTFFNNVLGIRGVFLKIKKASPSPIFKKKEGH
jgi:hypothetical protein